MTTSIPPALARRRGYSGPALFSAGFRSFFFSGAVWAAASVPLWIFLYLGAVALPTALSPLDWHIHGVEELGGLQSMPLRFLLSAIAALAAVALLASAAPSLANRAAADACAAKLGPDAKVIYAAVIDSVKTGDLVENIRSKTRGLVLSGKLERAKAQGAAEAAGACLKQAR